VQRLKGGKNSVLMNRSPLHFKMLEPALIIKNYVSGDAACNYETYLLEIINVSLFPSAFSKRFSPPKNQSHGECDAYSDSYGLDFKIIASKTAMQAKSIFSPQIIKIADGEYADCEPKIKGSIHATRFPQAIRGQSIEQLQAIRNRATDKHGIENDIREYLDTLETEKNLLLFFPYRFFYEQPGDLSADILDIVRLCNDDFGVTLDYRSKLYPTLDTYFVFLYDYYFVLCKWSKSALCFKEAIPVEESETFQHLAFTYCDEWVQKYDVILRMIQEEKTEEVVEREIDEEYRNLKHLLVDSSTYCPNIP